MVRRKFAWLSSFAAMLFLPVTTVSIYAEETPPLTEERQAALEALLPEGHELGMERDGEPVFYTDDLFMYINGAASAYHDLGFAALAHLYYVKDEIEIALDVYDMEEIIQAFGIFAAEQSDGVDRLNIGADGYLSGSILNFYQGPYYVKLAAWSSEDEVQALMKHLAAAVSNRIAQQFPDGCNAPELLKRLPSNGLLPNSIRYQKKSPLGYDHLAPALSGQYSWDEEAESVSQLLLSIAPDEETARERVVDLRRRLAERGEVEDYAIVGEGAFIAQDRYRGELISFARGAWAVVIANPPEDPSSWIDAIDKALSDKEAE